MNASSAKILVTVCAFATLTPLVFTPHRSSAILQETAPAWPSHFAGKPLRPLPLGLREQRFAADFPGRIARFTDGEREIVIRWVSRETRMLHSASDCFRGLGYSITARPLSVDASGARWGTFTARRRDQRLDVRERIYDAAGNEWTDVSAWYWSAAAGRSQGPWWAITTAQTAQ